MIAKETKPKSLIIHEGQDGILYAAYIDGDRELFPQKGSWTPIDKIPEWYEYSFSGIIGIWKVKYYSPIKVIAND